MLLHHCRLDNGRGTGSQPETRRLRREMGCDYSRILGWQTVKEHQEINMARGRLKAGAW